MCLASLTGPRAPYPVFSEWLLTSSITRLVLAIKSIETDETLERWQFDVHTDEAAAAGSSSSASASGSGASAPAAGGAAGGAGNGTKGGKKREKTEKEVQGEIREIMKQITSSVTFLPILEEPCGYRGYLRSSRRHMLFWILPRYIVAHKYTGTFSLLAYTNDSPDVAIPSTWDDADPHLIDRGKVEQVRLRSFSTNVHSLEVSRPRDSAE
jgi:mitotic spindle assembly checkpoint protein MAD2